MVRYFELDPTLKQQYDGVWRWADWPGNGGRPDNGVDLVARDAVSGEYTAIQCKFYEPGSYLAKGDLDSFFTESGKRPFTNRIIISTTDRWSSAAEEALENQIMAVQRIGLAEIAESPIRWDIAWPIADVLPEVNLSRRVKHRLRKHQQEALDAVFHGFEQGHDRGKLIMACGTGKTFTALRIAEKVAEDNGGSARILFAVPSISLLSQTLREWAGQARVDLRAFAVCSDTKVSRAAEDIATWDLPVPVTTDPARLREDMRRGRRTKGLTVVFTTYQSLAVVGEAQKLGLEDFDLVLADEAHRTTGVTLFGQDESAFVKIHDADFLRAQRRLYMTATPRIYDEATRAKADEHSAEITSMDDEDTYGPEFHRLSFGAAVERGLLTDYKVMVLTVDESMVAEPLQQQLAKDHGELRLDDASKIIGCWNGLAKRAGTSPAGQGFEPGEAPMRRAVAFAENIATSKQIAQVFPAVVNSYRDMLQESTFADLEQENNLDLEVAVRHVDGGMNALERNDKLAWLKAPTADNECRILTNVRCLSEGVDVPALDAVLFLHPRSSVVDVVQSVGRVMRKSEGKNYGYIILPVAVPAGESPSKALADNKRFRVVWQVLNALRAHDERFNAMVNSIAVNTAATGDLAKDTEGSNRLLGGHIGAVAEPGGPNRPDEVEALDTGDGTTVVTDPVDPAAEDRALAKQMALFGLSEWQEAIYARIVDKVGTRTYWEDWASDVADIASALISRIRAILDDAIPEIETGFAEFVAGLRNNLNDSISVDDAISMLAQHLITKPVFDALFEGHSFAQSNPVSVTMENMVTTLGEAGLEAETESLEAFYTSVRTRASEVTTAEGKQQVIADLYEKFFKLGFKKDADALGIVYTPTEIVDFINRAADDISKEVFGRGLTDENVHILDPFTGTGTFITRLLQSGLIQPEDLTRKYQSELHANEIMLLAYYIAAVNIETTYQGITGNSDASEAAQEYEPFEGIVLTDTFQLAEKDNELDALIFPQNSHRAARQQETPINIIIGNPPYSVGQTSANDLNANLKYPAVDGRIAETYVLHSTGSRKSQLYDSYIRAFRWATDRIGNQGIVAYVSNGGWIDGKTADGMRLSLTDEYSRIYVFNLRGNSRTAGEHAKREGGNVFNVRVGTAIFIGVKDPSHLGECELYYHNIGDYLSREEKLQRIENATLTTLQWENITPNSHGDWINQRSDHFTTWPVIGAKKPKRDQITFFKTYSLGLGTNRDAWVYNFSQTRLTENVKYMINAYEALREEITPLLGSKRGTERQAEVVNILKGSIKLAAHNERVTWARDFQQSLARNSEISYVSSSVHISSYRPFVKQTVYFSRAVNNMVYQLPSIFPTPCHENVGIGVTTPKPSGYFSVLTSDLLPCLDLFGQTAQFFSRWTYEKSESVEGQLDVGGGEVDEWGYRRIDNITDEILTLYRSEVGQEVTKDDIFYYVYGILHDPSYREEFAADLKKMLPHIPTPETADRFRHVAEIGRELADLHINYESADPYPVKVELKDDADPDDRETWRVTKMRWAKKKDPGTGKNVDDHTTLVYNGKVTITGIPEEASRYMLGSRSALAWLIDRYQVKTDKASGIVNDPNDWADEHNDPTYILDLIKKVTTVSVETMNLVAELLSRSEG